MFDQTLFDLLYRFNSAYFFIVKILYYYNFYRVKFKISFIILLAYFKCYFHVKFTITSQIYICIFQIKFKLFNNGSKMNTIIK